MNEELALIVILTEAANHPSLGRSNIGGLAFANRLPQPSRKPAVEALTSIGSPGR